MNILNELRVAKNLLAKGYEYVIIFSARTPNSNLVRGGIEPKTLSCAMGNTGCGRRFDNLYCPSLSIATRMIREDFPEEKNWTIMKTAEFINREGRIN
jgi:hypothetical protein